jgi:hypothetical protein
MAKPEIPTAEAQRRLLLFNEKAEKLQRSSFIAKVFHKDHGFTIHFGENKPLIVEKRGADEESTDALSLTLRFFYNLRVPKSESRRLMTCWEGASPGRTVRIQEPKDRQTSVGWVAERICSSPWAMSPSWMWRW